MNLIDILILFVVGISVVYGFYHGFIQTVSSLAALLLSIFAAFLIGPRLANYFMGDAAVTGLLSTYTDAVVRVGDFDLASSSVVNISQATVDTILKSVSLPAPLAEVLEQNLLTQAFQHLGIRSVNGYVSSTIVAAALQVLCYLASFAVVYLLLTVVISLIRHVANFPILRQLDWLAGGVFGLARGVAIVYLLLLLLPLISTVIPAQEGVESLVAQSKLAPLFGSDGFFVRIISG